MPHFDTIKIYSCGKHCENGEIACYKQFLLSHNVFYPIPLPDDKILDRSKLKQSAYNNSKFDENTLFPWGVKKVSLFGNGLYGTFFHFKWTLKCCMQFVPICTGLKFCRLVMG